MPTLYTSLDPGAPAPNAGNRTILKACLVNGYGNKPPAGWTNPFSEGTTDVLRNGESANSRLYFRLAGLNPTAYTDMTGPNTGTLAFPTGMTSWGHPPYLPAPSSPISWYVVADSRTAFLCVKSATYSVGFYMGDAVSLYPSDPYCSVICGGRNAAAVYEYGAPFAPADSSITGIGAPGNRWFVVWSSPTGGQDLLGLVVQMGFKINPWSTSGFFIPASVDDRHYAVPTYFITATSQNPSVVSPRLRGRFRWIYQISGDDSTWIDGSIINGVGAFSGKQFLVLRMTLPQSTVTPYWVALDLNET